MIEADVIREHFAKYGPFGSPCSPDDIAEAEERLALKIPDELRSLYLSYNGFRGPTYTAYLAPLVGNNGNSLVETTLLYWAEWSKPDFSRCLFFGSSSCDHSFIFNLSKPSAILAYHHHMEDEYEVAGTSILDAYLRDEQRLNILLSTK